MPPGKYRLIEEAAKHCWGQNWLEEFREFYADNAVLFLDAPMTLTGEQNLQYFELFQRYLRIYEKKLQAYIESLNVSESEFTEQLMEVRNDSTIQDKKLLYFVEYLIACTDYESFYKVMIRAAKKLRKADAKSGNDGGDLSNNAGGYAADSKSPVRGGDDKLSSSKGHK